MGYKHWTLIKTQYDRLVQRGGEKSQMFHELNPWGRVIDGKLLVPKPVPHFMEPKSS